jgi:hypothetical protein
MFLQPYVESQCVDRITSVTWAVEDPAVASIIPEVPAYSGSWVTGVATGVTAVTARIVFSDGLATNAESRAIEVVPLEAPPPGSILVEEGSTDSLSAGERGFIAFDLPQAARLVDLRTSPPLSSARGNVQLSPVQAGSSPQRPPAT